MIYLFIYFRTSLRRIKSYTTPEPGARPPPIGPVLRPHKVRLRCGRWRENTGEVDEGGWTKGGSSLAGCSSSGHHRWICPNSVPDVRLHWQIVSIKAPGNA